MSDTIIPIDMGLKYEASDEIVARHGLRRNVKLIPIPGNTACPAIWTNPRKIRDPDLGICVEVIVLVSKDPPQTMKITLPAEAYEHLPQVPIEW